MVFIDDPLLEALFVEEYRLEDFMMQWAWLIEERATITAQDVSEQYALARPHSPVWMYAYRPIGYEWSFGFLDPTELYTLYLSFVMWRRIASIPRFHRWL